MYRPRSMVVQFKQCFINQTLAENKVILVIHYRKVNRFSYMSVKHPNLVNHLILTLFQHRRGSIAGQDHKRYILIICCRHCRPIVAGCCRRSAGDHHRLIQFLCNSHRKIPCASLIHHRVTLEKWILLDGMDKRYITAPG